MPIDPSSGFADAPVGVALTAVDGTLLQVNAALADLLGCPSEALVGRRLLEVTHPDDVEAAAEACRIVNATRSRAWHVECRLLHESGTTVEVQVVTSWVAPTGPGRAHLVMVISDISARKARESELLHRALHDPLTGLPNRTLFDDRLAHALARGARERTPTCLLLVDVDAFKSVNDAHGHPVGDGVLRSVAARLGAGLRDSDTAARLGGDEFGVVCEDCAEADGRALADRLRAAVAAPLGVDGTVLTVSVSVGLAHVAGEDVGPRTALQLMREADASMYRDKGRR